MKSKITKLHSTEEPEEMQNMASEPQAAYYGSVNTSFYSPYKMIDVVRKGVSKNKLVELSKNTNIDMSDFAKLLHVSLRTIQRYADDDKLDAHISEHIMQIEKLYNKGYTMFKSPQDFNEWMKCELFAFNYKTPLSFLDTFSGVELVYNKIGQFEHGIFA